MSFICIKINIRILQLCLNMSKGGRIYRFDGNASLTGNLLSGCVNSSGSNVVHLSTFLVPLAISAQKRNYKENITDKKT